MEDKKPEFMMIYKCSSCGMDSGMTEGEQPVCHYCDKETTIELISKQKITPELMAERLKLLSERMFNNLKMAFENMSEEDKKAFPQGVDAEQQMLLLLAKAKKLKEGVQEMKLKEPGEEK